MYQPTHFEETRVDILHDALHAYPFATLVTLGADGLNANHIPFALDREPTPLGLLRGHVSRANPLWRDHAPDVEALVVFQGPQAYVSPSWYASKKESAKVVPTWNYIVVHAYGRLRVIEERDWLRRLVSQLTTRYEQGQPEPWQVTDAPADYIDSMLRAIVGIEIAITRLVGKWKLSQNRSDADRAGVIDALQASGNVAATAVAAAMKTK